MIALNLLLECERFLKTDNDVNESAARMIKSLADHIETNPHIFSEGMSRRVAERGPNYEGGLDAAGDLAGGDGWDTAKDVIRFIRELFGDEKPFIQEIIKHIIGMD